MLPRVTEGRARGASKKSTLIQARSTAHKFWFGNFPKFDILNQENLNLNMYHENKVYV